MVFPVVMYGCESWTIKKVVQLRIHACELWCWRRLLRVPWTASTSNQSILKEINPKCSLEGLMLKLKLQFFGHLMKRADSFEKTWYWEKLNIRGEGKDGGWDGGMRLSTKWTWVWVNSGSWWWAGRPGILHSMGSKKVKTWLNYWPELKWSGLVRVIRSSVTVSEVERCCLQGGRVLLVVVSKWLKNKLIRGTRTVSIIVKWEFDSGACRANSPIGKHYPWKPNCPWRDGPTDGFLAGIVCLSTALACSLRDALVAHVVGNMEDEGLNV